MDFKKSLLPVKSKRLTGVPVVLVGQSVALSQDHGLSSVPS
jgi:hypothetical protein